MEQPTNNTLNTTTPLKTPTEALGDVLSNPATQVSDNTENPVNDDTEGSVTLEPKSSLLSMIGLVEKDVEITITKGDLNQLVKEVLIIAALGGDIAPKHLPRMNSHPKIIKMVLPESAAEAYTKGEVTGEEVEGEDYNTFKISSVDPIVFIKEIIVAGKRGGIIKKGKTKFTSSVYSSYILIKNPLNVGPNITQLGKQITYTKEELKTYSIFDLKLIGAKYGVSHRGKDNLVKLILDKQEEAKNAE
jgi:hypothetical protein